MRRELSNAADRIGPPTAHRLDILRKGRMKHKRDLPNWRIYGVSALIGIGLAVAAALVLYRNSPHPDSQRICPPGSDAAGSFLRCSADFSD